MIVRYVINISGTLSNNTSGFYLEILQDNNINPIRVYDFGRYNGAVNAFATIYCYRIKDSTFFTRNLNGSSLYDFIPGCRLQVTDQNSSTSSGGPTIASLIVNMSIAGIMMS